MSLEDLKKSGGRRYLLYGLLLYVVGYITYSVLVSRGQLELATATFLGVMSIGIALVITALTETRLYEIKTTLERIERILNELKERKS